MNNIESRVDYLSIRTTDIDSSSLSSISCNLPVPSFSYTITVNACGTVVRARVTTATQRISDTLAEYAYTSAFLSPNNVKVSFQALQNDDSRDYQQDVIIGAPRQLHMSLWDAVLALGLWNGSIPLNDSVSDDDQYLQPMVECALNLGHSALVRDFILARST